MRSRYTNHRPLRLRLHHGTGCKGPVAALKATLRAAIALGHVLVAIEALGQVSGSASLVSDYRFRGVSLSQEKPALQLNVLYDDQSGWYAGAFASSVQIFGQHDRHVELVPFL